MLKNLTIHNFQSHKDTNLEFSNGVNIFTGASDCGKSSIMRSIVWCVKNNLQGNSFISHFAKSKDCSVTIDNVTRNRSSDENNYIVDGTKFEALRGNVPEQVEKVFNVANVSIQNQFDGAFMLCNSSGENARLVNELVNLTDIDKSTSWVNSNIRECNTEIKKLDVEKTNIQKNIIPVEDIATIRKNIQDLDNLSNTISELSEKILNNETLVTEFEKLKVYNTDGLEELTKNIERIKDLEFGANNTFNTLSKLLAEYNELSKIGECDIDIGKLEKAKKLATELNDFVCDIEKSIEDYYKFENDYASINEDIRILENQLSAMRCPLCGRI